jgi:hypothetical protein
MMDRKDFIGSLTGSMLASMLPGWMMQNGDRESSFAKRLKPVGRVLETEGYYVWCNSPVAGPDGKIHLFYSRWVSTKGMGGWIRGSEIAHAVAEHPEGPFEYVETVLAPRPGAWDATTCHNPLIKEYNGRYYLFYMGNSNGKTDTKRIGLAVADSLNGPWKRPDACLLEPGASGAWDDHCTTNPAWIPDRKGKFWLYYKSWNTKEYETGTGAVRGNRKYGLALADNPEGPYVKYEGNPVIDFSSRGNNAQLEDAFVWEQKKKIMMIARDMGYYNHEDGIIMDTRDGLHFSAPEIAYYKADKYITQPPAPANLKKYGRFERPQILFLKGRPAYLFTTSQGGRYMSSSPFVFRID